MTKNKFLSVTRTGFCLVFCALIVTVMFNSVGYANQFDPWEKADRETVRLVPAAFPQLPDPVIRKLNERGCSIPQPWESSRPQNVVSGEFKKPGQIDWAILCSAKGQSVILVFWGGSADNVEEIPGTLARDRQWLKGVAENRIGYSRIITAYDDGFILEHPEYYPKGAIHFVDSSGIVGSSSDKAPTIRYWSEGEWVVLQDAQ